MAAVMNVNTSVLQKYWALEATSQQKHELHQAQIIAMAGASRRHNLVVINVASELRQKLRLQPCETYMSDMRVSQQAMENYYYPDISVVCEPPQFENTNPETLLNPLIIIEVLSPTTERFDRGEKFAIYRQFSSIKTYLLISSERVLVEVYQRQEQGWLLREYNQLNQEALIESLNLALPLSALYERLDFSQSNPTTEQSP